MSLQSVVFDIDELHSFSDLSTFAQHIPVEWVASALDLSSSATIRRRRLKLATRESKDRSALSEQH